MKENCLGKKFYSKSEQRPFILCCSFFFLFIILFSSSWCIAGGRKKGPVAGIRKDYQFEMTVTGSVGIEKVKAIATLQPVGLFEFDFSKNIFDALPPGDLRAVRGVGGMKTKLDKRYFFIFI